MIVAAFYQGPFDGKRCVLPTEKPWPRFVIPKFDDPIDLEYFYLLAGQLDENLFSYLFDDSFGGIVPNNFGTPTG